VATPMIGRTLTQHAVPTTFGAVAAAWLDGIIDAAELLVVARTLLPAQIGGAVGTLAAPAELARLRGLDGSAVALRLSSRTAETLGLQTRRPWHTSRSPLTRTADAIVSTTDAWGHLATDVATLSRTEIGELSEPSAAGRGGSSTMPHKHNPVLSILIRRAAITTPSLAATIHLAAATSGDQRPDGVWHAEWAALRDLGRRAVVAASQTTELVQGLDVDTDRMRQTLNASAADALAERRGLADLVGTTADNDPLTYLGTAAELVAGAVERAAAFVEENE
jgi:3-carboxy-cis,cis-muconate cycloisomerase